MRRHKSGILAYHRPDATAKYFGDFLTTEDLVEPTLNLFMHRLREEVIKEFITEELKFEDEAVTECIGDRTLFSPPCDAIWEPSRCRRHESGKCPCSPGGTCHCEAWETHIVSWALTFEREKNRTRSEVHNLLASYGLTLISEPGKTFTPCEQRWVLGLQAYCEDWYGLKPTGDGAYISTSIGSDAVVRTDIDPDMEEQAEIEDGICGIDSACFSITKEERKRFYKIVRDLGLTLCPPGSMLLKENTPKLKSQPLTAEPTFPIVHQARVMRW